MPDHTLSAYRVVVKERRSEVRRFGDFDGKGADLLVVLQDFISGLVGGVRDDAEGESTLTVTTVYEPEQAQPRVLAAMMEVGTYGRSMDIRQRDQYAAAGVVFPVRGNHVATMPALLLLKLDHDKQQGIMIMHRPYGAGVKTQFWKEFKEYFDKKFPDYICTADTLVPAEAWKQAIDDGRVTKVRLIRMRRPNDSADSGDMEKYGEELGLVELVLNARRRFSLRKKPVTDAMTDDQARRSLLTYGTQDYDRAKITVVVGEKTRTIDVTSGARLPRLDLDISDEVDEDPKTGQPTYSSLREQAMDYVGLLETNPGWGGDA